MDEPRCATCGLVMTPKNAKLRPGLFYCDGCLPAVFRPKPAEHTSNAPHVSQSAQLYTELLEAKRLLANARADREILARERNAAEDERDKLTAFKAWVHAYLDGKGVPHHPPGVHGAEGCRIGDRMDWVWAELQAAQANAAALMRQRNAALAERDRLRDAARAFLALLDRTTFSVVALKGKELDALRRECE